jgi:hypothetical protein
VSQLSALTALQLESPGQHKLNVNQCKWEFIKAQIVGRLKMGKERSGVFRVIGTDVKRAYSMPPRFRTDCTENNLGSNHFCLARVNCHVIGVVISLGGGRFVRIAARVGSPMRLITYHRNLRQQWSSGIVARDIAGKEE